jgi:hypothetical protein
MASAPMNRRDFLKTGGAAVALGALHLGAPSAGLFAEEQRARVVLVRNAAVLGANQAPQREVLATMMDDAVRALFQTKTSAEAWLRVAGPKDVVGIKTNFWRFLRTPPELEDVVRERLTSAGVKAADIAIDDRGILKNDVFQRATALVNMRPLRTHHWAGVGSCLKNYIMFVPSPQDYHGDTCADLGAIWKLPHVAGRTRLNVLVLLTPLFHGIGPQHFDPEYTWPYAGLIVGADPVAVDATGLRILQAKRFLHFGEQRPITPPAKHIELAATRHGLGIADPKRIDIVKIGGGKDDLI